MLEEEEQEGNWEACYEKLSIFNELYRFIPSNGKRKIGSRHETTFATTKKPLDASP